MRFGLSSEYKPILKQARQVCKPAHSIELVNGDLLFATIMPQPVLHCFNPCCLGEHFQRWKMPVILSFAVGVKCCEIDCAPEVAKEIAQTMADVAEDGHTIFVISNPGSDLREACAKALGLHGQVRLCTLAKTPYGVPDPKLGRLLQIVAQQLSEHFLFSIDGHEKPILFGGCACDGSVVGFCPSSYV